MSFKNYLENIKNSILQNAFYNMEDKKLTKSDIEEYIQYHNISKIIILSYKKSKSASSVANQIIKILSLQTC